MSLSQSYQIQPQHLQQYQQHCFFKLFSPLSIIVDEPRLFLSIYPVYPATNVLLV